MKALQIFISYINFIFIFIILGVCLKVQQGSLYISYVSILFFAGILIYIALEFICKKKGIRVCIIFFISIVAVAAFGYYYVFGKDIYNILLVQYPWRIFDLYVTFSYINIDFILPYLIVIILPLSIIIAFIAVNGKNYINIFANIIIMLILWFWNYGYVLMRYVYVYSAIGAFTYILNSYYSAAIKVNIRKAAANLASVIICGTLISGVVFGIGTLMPSNHTGRYSAEIYQKINENGVKTNSEVQSGNHKFTGIESLSDLENENIGGPLEVDNNPVFEVKADKPMYLKSSVRDKYNDLKDIWESSSNELILVPRGVFLYSSTLLSDEKYKRDIAVYDNLKNERKSKLKILDDTHNTIFFPYLTYSIDTEDVLMDPTYSIRRENEYDSYTISYYNEPLNFDEAYKKGKFKDLIFYDDKGKTNFTKSEYDNYVRYNSNYLSGYENIDKRIVNLVKEIVKGSQSDAEKVYRIETYLRNNYTYSLKPKEVKSNLLYNFLFKEKKGYCVYFATAMTVMCKIAHVPARYVEGIKMSDTKSSLGNYVVTDRDAHAWTEVLVDPKLNMWYIVDATPSATQYYASEASTSDESSRDKSVLNIINNKNTDRFNFRQTAKNEVKKNTVKKPKAREVAKGKAYDSGSSILYLSLAVGLAVILMLRALWRRFIIGRALKKGTVMHLYSYSLRRLKTLNILKPKNIGEIEFAEGIKDIELNKIMKEIAKQFYLEHYGKKQGSSFNKKEFYITLENNIKKKQNKFKYYTLKYIIY